MSKEDGSPTNKHSEIEVKFEELKAAKRSGKGKFNNEGRGEIYAVYREIVQTVVGTDDWDKTIEDEESHDDKTTWEWAFAQKGTV